jgi:hypothetical protein
LSIISNKAAWDFSGSKEKHLLVAKDFFQKEKDR